MTTAAEIWQTLSKIDCSGKVENREGLTYLSWAWAWAELCKAFPDASYEIVKFDGQPFVYDEGLGYMVYTTVTISGLTREMWLPVMDSKNKAMKSKPYSYKTKYGEKHVMQASMFDVNKALMRCLTKNLAMFGLGHYIYAGEDLPEAVKEENGLKRQLFGMFKTAIKNDDCMLMLEAADRMSDEWWIGSYNSFDNNKTMQKKNVDRLLSEGRQIWAAHCTDLDANIADGHEDGMINELLKDIPSPYWQEKLKERLK